MPEKAIHKARLYRRNGCTSIKTWESVLDYKGEGMKDLQSIVEKNTVDGVVNWAAIEKIINDESNGIAKRDADKAAESARTELLKNLGYDSEENLKKALEGGGDLQKQIDRLTKENEALTISVNDLKNEKTKNAHYAILSSDEIGIDKDFLDYVYGQIDKGKDDEEFKTNAKKYADEHLKYKAETFKNIDANIAGGGKGPKNLADMKDANEVADYLKDHNLDGTPKK